MDALQIYDEQCEINDFKSCKNNQRKGPDFQIKSDFTMGGQELVAENHGNLETIQGGTMSKDMSTVQISRTISYLAALAVIKDGSGGQKIYEDMMEPPEPHLLICGATLFCFNRQRNSM